MSNGEERFSFAEADSGLGFIEMTGEREIGGVLISWTAQGTRGRESDVCGLQMYELRLIGEGGQDLVWEQEREEAHGEGNRRETDPLRRIPI